MAKYNNQGWHNQSLRHSRAAKTGHAGGKYANKYNFVIKERIKNGYLIANEKGQKEISKEDLKYYGLKDDSFGELKKKGVYLDYQGDADKDGVVNIKDCKPLNPKKQGNKSEDIMNMDYEIWKKHGWEHLGMVDIPTYRKELKQKLKEKGIKKHSLSKSVYKDLENDNYHLENEELEDMGYYK